MLGQSDGRLHVRVSDLFKLDNLPKISEEEGIIYCCLNLINDKAYIGKSKYSIQGRWTHLMESVFSRYDLSDNKIVIKELITSIHKL